MSAVLYITFSLLAGLGIGSGVTVWMMAHSLKTVVRVDITADSFAKAEAKCAEYGGDLQRVIVYYDKDVLYCDGMKIIAKKDSEQKMWMSFEVIRAEAEKEES